MTIYEKIKTMDLDEMIENNVICKFVPVEICQMRNIDDVNCCKKCQTEFAKLDIFNGGVEAVVKIKEEK